MMTDDNVGSIAIADDNDNDNGSGITTADNNDNDNDSSSRSSITIADNKDDDNSSSNAIADNTSKLFDLSINALIIMLNYLNINDIHQLDIASPTIVTKAMSHHHAILDNITLYTDIDQAMIWIGKRKININSLTIRCKQMMMTDAGCIGLSNHCITLESLNLCSQPITDAGITAIIDNATNLRTLNISYCKNISDDTLFSLTQ